MKVTPKKHLGQHFLTDASIAQDIVEALVLLPNHPKNILEIGPGTGVLTQFLVHHLNTHFKVIEIDTESVKYLKSKYPDLHIIPGDFLQNHTGGYFGNEPYGIIGNFPYNISSQIFFNILENPHLVTHVVCMLQKEVAERLCSPPGNKDYGILSVFLQAYYDVEYLFTVPEYVFDPPPKVKSGVIRLTRNFSKKLQCDEALFRKTVKQAFSMRRKTMRNAFKPWNLQPQLLELPVFNQRAEELSVEEFEKLTQRIFT